jgi:hypothetical protein
MAILHWPPCTIKWAIIRVSASIHTQVCKEPDKYNSYEQTKTYMSKMTCINSYHYGWYVLGTSFITAII